MVDTMQFWLENPNIILQNLTEVWPSDEMGTTQKLNAISRLILVLTVLGLCFSRNKAKVGIAGVVSLALIAGIFYYKGSESIVHEGFKVEVAEPDDVEGVKCDVVSEERPVEMHNPFNNVMVPEYGTKAAERPAIREEDLEETFEKVKTNTVRLFQNEDEIEDEEVKEKLFSSLGDNYLFASSMRNYVSNPNTAVMNNQNAFAEFCYGQMSSIKENGIHPE